MQPAPDPATHDLRRDALPLLAIVAMTAVWGSTFVIIKDAVEGMPIGSFLAARFAIAAAALAILVPRSIGRLSREDWRLGTWLGLLYGAAQLAQTWGLSMTSPSISGFVTGLYVVFTPLIVAVLLRRRVGATAWIAVALAFGGIAVLSLRGWAIGPGELLTAVAALLYAGHIVALGAWSRGRDAIGLTVVQLAVVALTAAIAMPLDGSVELPSGGQEWFAVLYCALVAGSLVLVLQTWAQARLDPTRTAVVMTLEPVFAAGFAIAVGVDELTVRLAVGGALVLAAMYLVELGPRLRADTTKRAPGLDR